MFRVENADFIADKLASELLPDQEQREVFKNAEEAVLRRMAADGAQDGGRVVFDVDWQLHAAGDGEWLLCCADNGDGMTRAELERYMTTLAVQGAGNNQSIPGNQGMGLKVAGPTRHRRGVLIRSLKDGQRSMVQVGWNGTEYDLIPLGDDGQVIVDVGEDMFPAFVLEQGSGTVVTFLGNADGDNTVLPDGRDPGWLAQYLHQRFHRLSDGPVQVLARVPGEDPAAWPAALEQAKGPGFPLQEVQGTAAVWDEIADGQGDGYRGTVRVPGARGRGIPAADVHWWVLPERHGRALAGRTYGGGSLAVLFQNELHDWRTGNQANPFFARLGVLFGKSRIVFAVEPLGDEITSDFARAHVLVSGTAVLETEAWLTWAEQFRAAMPQRMKDAMSEEQSQLQIEDPDRAKRIRNRLKDVMDLLKPRRFQPAKPPPGGAAPATAKGEGEEAEAPKRAERAAAERTPREKPAKPRGVGAALARPGDPQGRVAEEVHALLSITPQWVSVEEAETFSIVNADGRGLRDRAAALAGQDGASAEMLLLNREFRGYQALIAAVGEWGNPDGDPDVTLKIETLVQEWVEQKMVEAVNGLRQLENGSTWTAVNFDDALSPVALTAVFMADRWHTLREVKRQVAPLRAGA